MTHRPIILYKRGPNKIYTHYGIPFQCVELIRRYFILYYGLTFQSIPDAFDMFSSVNSLIHIKTKRNILLETILSKDVDDLRVGDIIFWKRSRINDNYGHVGIVVSSTKMNVIVAQQNTDNLVEKYNKSDIISEMNKKKSKFLGIKRLPDYIIIPIRIRYQIK